MWRIRAPVLISKMETEMEYVIREKQLNALESVSAQIGLLATLASQVTTNDMVIEVFFFVETMHSLQTRMDYVLKELENKEP